MKITALKKTRQEKAVTQEALAKKVKISVMTYYRYESGERLPDVHTAQRLADALGVDVKDLFPLPIETSPDEALTRES